jgi:hypothetical protein
LLALLISWTAQDAGAQDLAPAQAAPPLAEQAVTASLPSDFEQTMLIDAPIPPRLQHAKFDMAGHSAGTAITLSSRSQAQMPQATEAIRVRPGESVGISQKVQESVAGLWGLATQPDVSQTPTAAAAPPGPVANSHPAQGSAHRTRTKASAIAESLGSLVLQPIQLTTVDEANSFQQFSFAENGDLADPVRTEPAVGDARLVAYLQELPAESDQSNVDLNAELMPEPAATGGQAQDGAAQGDSLADAERVGEAPEDRSLQFLRTETVLLEPGESQCDVGINYLLTENDFPILLTDDMNNIVAVDEVDFRIRELTVPFEYRIGLLPRVQGFIGAPIGWSNTQVALDAFDAFQNDGGFGDIDFGLTAQFAEAGANCPYIIGTLAATAPTGGDPFTGALSLAPNAPSLGQGFWSIAGSLLFIQPYDPVVVFYGIGTEHFFARHYVGVEIEPGPQYNYQLGVGFAVNERITLSTRFFGAYIEEIKVNGDRRFGTNIEPMTIRLSATISQPCDRLVEPFVEFGITDDAVSSFIGITWTFSPNSHRNATDKKR